MCAGGVVWEWFKNANGDDVLHIPMSEGLITATNAPLVML